MKRMKRATFIMLMMTMIELNMMEQRDVSQTPVVAFLVKVDGDNDLP